MVQRRTLALDEELIIKLKEIAKRRGTTLSNYLRSLLREAIDLEDRGYYAPKALRERKYEYVLTSLGFTYVPREVALTQGLNSDEVRALGSRLGRILKELGVDVLEVIDLLSSYCSNVIADSSKIVILPMPNTAEHVLAKIVAEIAKAAGMEVKEDETLVTIELPSEELRKKLSEFSPRRRRR